MKSIRIYSDLGVSDFARQEVPESLMQVLDLNDYQVESISADQIQNSSWEEDTTVLVIPGGRDLPYLEQLSGIGNARIVRFVKAGGSFLGLCAGAYYASRLVEFAKHEAHEVCGERELRFFSGRAVGPATGPASYKYDSEFGARAARLECSSGSTLVVYYNGGCYFEDAAQDKNVKVLAKYTDFAEAQPAIIACDVGRGKVILSGVHIEYRALSVSRLFKSSDARLQTVAEQLKLYDLERNRFLADIMQTLCSKGNAN